MKKLKRSLYALAAISLCSSALWAGILIRTDQHVRNRDPGYCTWCCLEMLGRVHKIKELDGLVDWRASLPDYVAGRLGESYPRAAGDEYQAGRLLGLLGIVHQVQHAGNKDDAILHYAVSKNLGAVIGVNRDPAIAPGPHAVILADWDDNFATLVDPNVREHHWQVTRTWLRTHWDGFAIVVEPRKGQP